MSRTDDPTRTDATPDPAGDPGPRAPHADAPHADALDAARHAAARRACDHRDRRRARHANHPWLGLSLVVAAVVAFSVLAPGCRAHRGLSPERLSEVVGWKVDDALDSIDATDAQRAEVEAVVQGVLADLETLRGRHEGDAAVVVEELSGDAPDAERLHALVDERLAEVGAFAHAAVDAVLEVHGALTPEQRAELLAKAAERHGRRRPGA